MDTVELPVKLCKFINTLKECGIISKWAIHQMEDVDSRTRLIIDWDCNESQGNYNIVYRKKKPSEIRRDSRNKKRFDQSRLSVSQKTSIDIAPISRVQSADDISLVSPDYVRKGSSIKSIDVNYIDSGCNTGFTEIEEPVHE